MSYDLDVVIKRTIHSSNYTSNVYPMFVEAYERAIKNDIEYGIPDYVSKYIKDWKEALTEPEQRYSLPVLKGMIAEMRKDPETFKKWDDPNGWGDYEGALKFLVDAFNAMLISETAVIELSD